ncbi:MAG: adenylate/guanylate cyclase domain-containing protein, partial [Deltaproteobacteria bacterium]|nr:adenylate/guanylate cyclase domain-containing protein [Deltaproteobacteria bacterium]
MDNASRPFQHIPLTLKMVLFTIIVGIAVWAAIDLIQTRSLRNIFQAQLTERLSKQSLKDRLHFDEHISTYSQLNRLLVTQKTLIDFIKSNQWLQDDTIDVKYHRTLPSWLPKRSVMRTFAQTRYALILDDWGRAREVYKGRYDHPPQGLLQPTKRILELSRDQSLLTTLGGDPYLITSGIIEPQTVGKHAILVLASPIDEKFIIDSQGSYRGRLLALVIGEEIITSSNLELLPKGSNLVNLQDSYLVTGQEFFEYGDAELPFKFTSVISRDEMEALTGEIVTKGRNQRAIMAFLLILSFTLIMFWITKNIAQLTYRISDFSEKMLYGKAEKAQRGDELIILENRFHRLTEDVVTAQNIIRTMFSSYVSPKVVEELLLDPKKARLGSEKREVTILFADIIGFTSLCEKLNPEEVVSLLNEYFKDMTDVIFSFEGTFDKLIGDKIMAFWGAPVEQANHAELAVRCSLQMAKNLRNLRKKWKMEGKPQLETGIGINTGE